MPEHRIQNGIQTPELKLLVQDYLRVFPGENSRVEKLTSFLNACDPERVFDRSNGDGHITASAFILSPCRKELLLIQHPELNVPLQPGGHIEPCDSSPLAGALREVREETGLTGLRQILINSSHLVPFDIDIHYISRNPSKDEIGHYHYDFRYLFVSTSKAPMHVPLSHDWCWVDINNLQNTGSQKLIIEKIRYALTKETRASAFYERVVDHLEMHHPTDTVVVAHLIPDVIPFLTALSRVSHVLAVIPKPRSVVKDVRDRLENDFVLRSMDRETIAQHGLGPLVAHSDGLALLDIGGYFAPLISNPEFIHKSEIVGVIEDTENGHQKYSALHKHTIPIFSVARSPLKNNEDFLVGQSVVFSADAILREMGHLLQYMRVGIIGFGKIGKSILHHLLQRNLVPMVNECNPIRLLEAYNQGASIPHRSAFLSEAEVIFSATGNKALSLEDFRVLRPGCFVFSVTSSDDEMDISSLSQEYDTHIVGAQITQLYGRHNYFYLINGGNAVNFIHKAVLGDFIHLVRAEMLCALEVLSHRNVTAGVHEVPEETRKRIATLWLDSFVS
jgi:S-adenosylhomocysteine hydrolase/8-oxo-dGTP pyrophosphatase MutT (NUDIX family)